MALPKKKLLSLPRLPISDTEIGAAVRNNEGVVLKATFSEADGQKVAVITAAATKPMWRYVSGKDWTEAVFFLMEDGWKSFLTLEDKTTTWSDASPAKLLHCEWCAKGKERETLDEAVKALGGESFRSYETGLLEKAVQKRNSRKIDRILMDIGQFSDKLPVEYRNGRAEKKAFSQHEYLFMKGKGKGYCTACKKDVLFKKKHVHNEEGFCPSCKKPVTFKSAGKGRKNLIFPEWTCHISASPSGQILFRYFRHLRTLEDYRNPWISQPFELYRAVVEKDGSFCVYEYLGDRNSVTKATGGWGEPIKHTMSCWQEPSAWNVPEQTAIVQTPGQIRKILADTEFRHSGFAEFSVFQKKPFPHYYLTVQKQFPFLEKLAKCGFGRIIGSTLGEYGGIQTLKKFNPYARDIKKLLGVTGNEYRLISKKPAKTGLDDISAIKDFRTMFGREIREEEYFLYMKIKTIYGKGYLGVTDVFRDFMWLMTQHKMTLRKALRYCEAQKIAPHIWREYLQWLRELGLARNDELLLHPSDFLKFPRNFSEAHDLKAKEIKECRDEIAAAKKKQADAELEKFSRQFAKEMKAAHGGISVKGYLVRPPRNLDELSREGEWLHHCVGTYRQSVAEGRTSIFFIRRTEDPETPYFTLEWKNGKVIQCHGMHNCEPTLEIEALLQQFKKFMLQMEAKKKENLPAAV